MMWEIHIVNDSAVSTVFGLLDLVTTVNYEAKDSWLLIQSIRPVYLDVLEHSQ